MKQETAEDMLEFAKEVCQKYSRVKTLAEETQMQWRQDLEMAADSKYPGEKEMYDRQAEESLARYTAVREWLELADAAAFRIRDSKAQIVVRQHCLDRIPLKAVEFENGKHMSIAGKRDGLDGSRSSLFYEAIRIVKEMRCKTNGEKPRFIVWENVPGAFSSNKGQDFKAVLEAVISVKEPSASVPAPEKKGWPDADYYVGDGWSVAYRVFDAQWWGVPQRRKRIYLVADFADQSAPEILFNSEGLSRYSAEGFRAWQRAAAGAEGCTGEAGCNGAGGRICLNDQGGTQMDVSEDVTGTLRAQEHGHQPCVLEAAGFCTEHSADARSIGYEEERSPTLRAGVVPAAIALENHPADSRVKISEDGKVQTLTSRCGTGGGNVPMVMDAVENSVESPVKEVENSPTVTLKIRSGCEGGGKGAIWQEEKSATLGCNNDQTLFVPKCYGVCSKASHSMMSDNPHSGFYEAETSRTLDRSGGDPTCNQGGICVVEPVAFTQNQRDEVRDLGEKSAALAAEPGMKQQTFVLQGNMIGRKDENGPQGDGVNEDVHWMPLTAMQSVHRRMCMP